MCRVVYVTLLALWLSACAGGEQVSWDPATATLPGPGELVDEPVFGGKVFVFQAGVERPETAVLIHGLGPSASADWALLIPALIERFHVVAFDLPGFGRSSGGNHLYSPAAYAQLVHWLTERYAKGPVIVIGHSLGAAVALRFAAEHPHAVRRMVLSDVAGVLHRVAFLEHTYRIEPSGDRAETSYSRRYQRQLNRVLRKVILRMDRLPLEAETVLASPALRRLVLGGSPRKIAAMALIQEDFSKSLAAIRVPVRLLWGAEDEIAPLRTAQVLLHALSDVRLDIIAGAGHAPMLDVPEVFLGAVLAALVSPPDAPRFSAPPPSTARWGVCAGQEGVRFEGDYEEIAVEDCLGVSIVGVKARSIRIARSKVRIERTSVAGAIVGLNVSNSSVVATALAVRAETALVASRSHLDLAGVSLEGTAAAARSSDRAVLVFSVSRVASPHGRGRVHGVHDLAASSSL
ncbi:MAG: alpha/beta hydrolase [Thermodesulfobacteriota bacterium]|jgi:pimeloyl-ACP methyl ester carboxylesterase